MEKVIQQIAKEYKEALSNFYGIELAELILFGSYAREDYKPESDIDFAIVLHNPSIRPAAEILRTSCIASKLSLKYGLSISSLHVALQKNKIHYKEYIRKFAKKAFLYE